MALVDDIILQRGQVLVSPGATDYGLYVIAGSSALTFGTVALICELSDYVEIGQVVMFDMKKAQQRFAIGSTIYYLTDENNIFLSETIVP